MSESLAAFAVLAWLAYLTSRVLARRKVPELVGFLAVGAALGPSGVALLDSDTLARMAPITEIALAVLMFVIGERVSKPALRSARYALTSAAGQYLLAGGLTYLVAVALDADPEVALLLATLAGAGAPLTVAAVITSARARGPYAAGLVSTHALCDALAAAAFAAVLPLTSLLADDSVTVGDALVDFAALGAGGVLLGAAFGWIIARFGPQIETSGELLLFVLVHLLVGWAAADATDLSLPLAALVAGAVAASIMPSEAVGRTFRTVRTIEQPLYLLFFALAGAAIHLEDVPEVGLVGVGYLVARSAGKVIGGWLGAMAGGLGWRRAFQLGTDSVPQAGVAVGLAVLASEQLPGPGTDAATIVLGSVVVFELVGPLLVARNLHRGPDPVADMTEALDPSTSRPRVVVIASQVPLKVPDWLLDECDRWDSELIALLPGDADAPELEELRDGAMRRGLELSRRRWVPGESFTGTVVRLCESEEAGLLVVPATSTSSLGSGSRLVLLPHERIGRQVECPVVLLPLNEPEHAVEAEPVGRSWWRWWRRSGQPPVPLPEAGADDEAGVLDGEGNFTGEVSVSSGNGSIEADGAAGQGAGGDEPGSESAPTQAPNQEVGGRRGRS